MHTLLPSVSDPVVKIWAKSIYEFNANYPEVLTVFRFMPTLYRDHENFGKNTTIFSHTFVKHLIILRVNKVFLGKCCTSVLFTNCFPFNIKIPAKYNTVLLVVN